MKHNLFATIDEMLTPNTLSELTGAPVTDVCRHAKPEKWGGNSGSALEIIETNRGTGQCYILKQISQKRDHIMRGSNDEKGRAVTLWQHGLMDRLPPEAASPIIACAHDAEGWAILMHDVSDAVFHQGATFDHAQNRAFLEALAAIHATFWEQPFLSDDSLGINSLQNYFGWMSLETNRRVAEPDNLANLVVAGWKKVRTVLDPDVADIMLNLIEDPQPLYDALSRYPHTLIHGDYWCPNIGLEYQPQKRVTVLDWQLAAFAPPVIDLAWYLVTAATPLANAPSAIDTIKNGQALATILPVSRDESIDIYKQALAKRLGSRFSEQWWQPQLELGLMVGLLRIAWIYPTMLTNSDPQSEEMHPYWQESLTWWSERVRIGKKRLQMA